MGVMKRIIGWRDSRWPIPRPLQVLAGLVEARDPEAYRELVLERKLERIAIQAEAAPVAIAAANAPPRERSPAPPLPDLLADDWELGQDLPARAADGWYRLGRSFYRVGQGPFPLFGSASAPAPGEPVRLVQRSLFA